MGGGPVIVDRPTVGTTHKMVPNTETTDDVVGNNEHNKKESNTHNLFFFGTLMVPSILSRVLHHRSPLELKNIVMQPALLHGYTRLAVAGTDYPAIVDAETSSRWIGRELHESESSVEGVYVMGLTDEDAEVLDVFEGEEYERVSLEISTVYSNSQCILPSSETESTTGNNTQLQPQPQLPTQSNPTTNKVTAECYVWIAGVEKLEKEVWDFESFLEHKSAKWANGESEEFRSRASAQGGLEELDGEVSKIEFGHNLLKYWAFEDGYVNLNHGSYGSPPLPVISAMRALSVECEKNPDKFIRRTYQPLLRSVIKELAEMIGADVEDCVLTGNATTSMNTITWNLDYQPGDVLIAYSTTYPAARQTLKQICDKYTDVEYVEIDLTFPMSHGEIVRRTEDMLKTYAGQKEKRVKLVCVDAIASLPGMIFPWESIVQLCKRYSCLSLVDAAHQIGQLPVNLRASQPDFWLSNCHKWLMCHRGVSILYVAKHLQSKIRTSIPTSSGYVSTKYPSLSGEWAFGPQFEWTGAVDSTPFLSVTNAIAFRKFLGGEERIMAYCHDLAVVGGKRAAEILGTDVMENEDPSDGILTAAMVNVRLPILSPPSGDPRVLTEQINFLVDSQFEANVSSFPYVHAGVWWIRLSAQVWTELEDFEKVARVFKGIVERFDEKGWVGGSLRQVKG